MSGAISVRGQLTAEVDDALLRLIRVHLGAHGMALNNEQMLRVRQQGPVMQFLDGILDVARRQIDQDQTPEIALTPMPRAIDACTAWSPPTPSVPDPQGPASDGPSAAMNNEPAPRPGAGPTPAAAAPAPTAPAAAPEPTSPPPSAATAPTAAAVPATVSAQPSVFPVSPTPAGTPEPPKPPVMSRPAIRLPNATADTDYRQVLALDKTPDLEGFRIVRIDGLEGTGMRFDAASGALEGKPATDPKQTKDLVFPARLEKQQGERAIQRDASFTLLVNPHPRALWKQMDPDPSLPFRKPHTRSAALGTALRVVAASVRGRSHANSGTFREDDFHMANDASGQWLIVAVSDGAGSARLSRRGSQIAAQTSVSLLAEALPAIDEKLLQVLPPDKAALMSSNSEQAALQAALNDLFLEPVGRAAFGASRAIVAEAKNLQADEKALAATLLFAAVRQYGNGVLVASYWVGDGAAAVFDPKVGTLSLLGDADSGEFSGQTRFLLSTEFGSDAWSSIRKRFRCTWRPAGAVVVLMTDGVSDPKFGTDNALKDPERWLAWWRNDLCASVALARDHHATPTELESYLDFWSQGEHDDRTLALVY